MQRVEEVTGFPEMLDGAGCAPASWCSPACSHQVSLPACLHAGLHMGEVDYIDDAKLPDFWQFIAQIVRRICRITMPTFRVLGRVKTLHPGVHGGILARRDLPAHLDALQQQGISLIDLASSLFCPHLLPSIPSSCLGLSRELRIW